MSKMINTWLNSLAIVLLLSFTASSAQAAEGETQVVEAADKVPATAESPEITTENTEATPETTETLSIMEQPVDFSSPEAIEATRENIRQQAGEESLYTLDSALKYIMFYDLSMNRDKEKLYKRMNGKTPNQIIKKASRS
jgi:hypothetical protein